MKFDCGETRTEKEARLSQWHPFFCLFPRKMSYSNHDCRWMEKVQRRGYYSHFTEGMVWEYRPIPNFGD